MYELSYDHISDIMVRSLQNFWDAWYAHIKSQLVHVAPDNLDGSFSLGKSPSRLAWLVGVQCLWRKQGEAAKKKTLWMERDLLFGKKSGVHHVYQNLPTHLISENRIWKKRCSSILTISWPKFRVNHRHEAMENSWFSGPHCCQCHGGLGGIRRWRFMKGHF